MIHFFLFFLSGISCLTVDMTPVTPVGPLPQNYVGFSVEYFGIRKLFLSSPFQPPPSVLNFKTDAPKRLNMVTMQLLQNLGQLTRSNVPLIIRIGGNSATETWVQGVTNVTQYTIQNVVVSDWDFQILGMVANFINVKYIMNVGMFSSQPTLAPFVIQMIQKYIPASNILAIELGNEPDHYVKKGIRPTTYTPDQFFAEYDSYVQLIRQTMGNVDLMGPGYAYDWRDAGFQIPFIQQKAATTKYMSFHRYALKGCSNNTSLDLLMQDPIPNMYTWVSDISAVTKQTNTLNVWGEGGTASCSGVQGTSDVYGSGLWLIDSAFEMASRGVDLALFSGAPQAEYGPIVVDGYLDVRAGFYGMLMFSLAQNGPNAQIYRPNNQGNSTLLKAWASVDSVANTYTLVVVHKSETNDEPVTLTLPAGAPSGAVGQLVVFTGPALASPNGQTIGGMTFDNSTNGLPNGQYSEQLLQPQGNQFTFTAKKASATLVRISFGNSNPAPLFNLQISDGIRNLSKITGIPIGNKSLSSGSTLLPSLLLAVFCLLL